MLNYNNFLNVIKSKINFNWFKQPKIYLGRWQLTECPNQIRSKIDLANEDHCGPCGQYALIKQKQNNDEKKHKPVSSK